MDAVIPFNVPFEVLFSANNDRTWFMLSVNAVSKVKLFEICVVLQQK